MALRAGRMEARNPVAASTPATDPYTVGHRAPQQGDQGEGIGSRSG